MKSVSRNVEIARFAGGVQVSKGESNAVQLVGGYSAVVVSLVEPPQPSMAKRTDHGVIIPRAGTVISAMHLPASDDKRMRAVEWSTKLFR